MSPGQNQLGETNNCRIRHLDKKMDAMNTIILSKLTLTSGSFLVGTQGHRYQLHDPGVPLTTITRQKSSLRWVHTL